jgi:hypothetical protein
MKSPRVRDGGKRSPITPETPPDARSGAAGDRVVLAVECVIVLALWLLFVRSLGYPAVMLGYDSIRDIATAHGIARGQWAMDPMLHGQPAWYPPGMPALFALAARVSGAGVAAAYASAAWWQAWINPLVLFLLVRGVWGRTAAWAALACVLVGSRWWMVHAAVPMASVQSVALTLATLAAWHRAASRGGRWIVCTGLLAAAALWCHLLCAGVALGAIAVHAAGALLLGRVDGERPGKALAARAAAVAAIALSLGAPPLLRHLLAERLNDVPTHWFGPELHDPRFALHAYAPLVVLFGLFGIVRSVRDWRRTGWLAGGFAFALVGSLFGYAGHDLGWPLPWALPHEFQWHEQLLLMIAAGAGIAALARDVARRTSPRARWAVAAAALAVAVGPALPQLKEANGYLLRVGPDWAPILGTADWLDRHAAPDAVVAAPMGAGYFVCGLSGRRAVTLPSGHLNPAVDPAPRARDLEAMLSATSESTFVALARTHHVDYLLATNDRAPQALLHERYAGWKSLKQVYQSDSLAVLYEVRTTIAQR